MSQMGPAYRNAGGVTETRTAKTAATRKTARARKGCATPRPNSPAKTQVESAAPVRNKKLKGQGTVMAAKVCPRGLCVCACVLSNVSALIRLRRFVTVLHE